jgi:O-antigen biosynthesis protein
MVSSRCALSQGYEIRTELEVPGCYILIWRRILLAEDGQLCCKIYTMNKKILVVHPEGNANNNPNLTGIVEILCENGYTVEIVSPRSPVISQKSPCAGAFFRLVDVADSSSALFFPFTAPLHLFENPDMLASYLRTAFHDVDIVIGVDRGIIDASLIARSLGVPVGLISYEIFSAEELGSDLKAMEIEACRGLSFTVCQDRMRASLLGRENHIPVDDILDIPVSGRGFIRPSQKTFALHDHLHLDRSTKIAAYIGSVNFPWSMIGELLETLPEWPTDWVLLLHHRYGPNQLQALFRQYPFIERSEKIYISPYQQLDFKDLPVILRDVDLGIAFYVPMEKDVFAGNNLKCIGMASGKIATYLQHGLPIMVNNLYPWNEMIPSFGIGCVIHTPPEIPLRLKNLTTDEIRKYRTNIPGFFASHLDLNAKIQPLLQRVRELIDL